MVKCLNCEKEMAVKDFDGMEVQYCPDCGGVWLKGGDMEDLIGLDPDSGRVISCEECGWTMNTRVILGVEIDYCPSCGAVWLDPGELEKIVLKHHAKGKRELIDWIKSRV